MKKSILSLAAVAVFGLFMTSCEPDVTFEGINDIVVDLGSTDADVLAGVTASNDAEVTVTGIDYDKAGEHNAIFTAKDATAEAVVKIKTDKLAGDYEYTMTIDGDEEPGVEQIEIKQSSTTYNKILIEKYLANASIEAVCNGTDITIDEFNISVEGETYTAKVTGIGNFVKLEGGSYAIEQITFTLVWSFGETSVEVLDCTKL